MSGYGDIIYGRLTTYGATSAQLGTRVYAVDVPQATPAPYAVYEGVSRVRVGETANIYRRRVQISTWAEPYDTAVLIADAIFAALDEYKYFQASPPHLLGCELVNQTETFDDDTLLHGILSDYFLTLIESS